MTARAEEWNPAFLMREATENLRSSRRRLRPVLLIAVFLGVLLPIVAAVDSAAYRADMEALRNAGASVIVISSDAGEEAIARRSCDRLVDMDGIERSGSVLTSTRVPVVGLGDGIPITPVTGTLVPGLATSRVVIGHDLTTKASQRVVLSGVPVVGSRGQAQPEGIPVNAALAVAASPALASVERCTVVLEPGLVATSYLSEVLAAVDTHAAAVTASPVLTQPVDRTDAFLTRLTRWSPAVAGVLLGALHTIMLMTRQSELAAYRLSGTRQAELRTILIFETALVSGAMATSAVVAVLVLNWAMVSSAAAALSGLGAASIAFACGAVASTFVSRQSLLNLSKER